MDENQFYWRTSMNGIQFGTSDTWKYGLSDEVITFETGK
jgi:hypothetical protein